MKTSLTAIVIGLALVDTSIAQEEKAKPDSATVDALIKQLQDVRAELAKRGIAVPSLPDSYKSTPPTTVGTDDFDVPPGHPRSTAHIQARIEKEIPPSRNRSNCCRSKIKRNQARFWSYGIDWGH